MAVKRYETTDAEWERIKDMIHRVKIGRPPKDDQMVLNGMLWLARSGAAWANIPARHEPIRLYTSVSVNGVIERFCGFFKL